MKLINNDSTIFLLYHPPIFHFCLDSRLFTMTRVNISSSWNPVCCLCWDWTKEVDVAGKNKMVWLESLEIYEKTKKPKKPQVGPQPCSEFLYVSTCQIQTPMYNSVGESQAPINRTEFLWKFRLWQETQDRLFHNCYFTITILGESISLLYPIYKHKLQVN